jgi:hypothetical protein
VRVLRETKILQMAESAGLGMMPQEEGDLSWMTLDDEEELLPKQIKAAPVKRYVLAFLSKAFVLDCSAFDAFIGPNDSR